jgi:multiple sugar transport system substrate-binding protein
MEKTARKARDREERTRMTGIRRERPGTPEARRYSRRDFLKVGGAGLAGTALLGAAGCGGGGSGSGNLVFTMGTDTSGTLQGLIDKFNKENKGKLKVTYREMPTDTGQYFDKIKTEFQAGQSNIDIIGGDVIWTAQMAANGWVLDVTDRFPKSEQSKYLPAPIESLTYDDKIWGKPWFTDAGLLFYRADLLEKSGFSEPPQTWMELQEMAEKVMQDQGIKYGIVFQGSNYEGGVCNALEYVWTHGGDVLDGDEVIIDSPETVAGLETQRGFVTDGLAPEGVSTYTETETDPAFLGGDTVFARNWSYMYALAGTSDYPDVTPEKIGVTSIPTVEGAPKANCQGGWNLLISANSDLQEEAWEFVQWMSAEPAQKERALSATLLPTRTSLYDDPEVNEKVPTTVVAKTALTNAKPRPVSPYYSDMSLEMSEQFNTSLKGDESPEAAVKTLQDSLQQIVEQAS